MSCLLDKLLRRGLISGIYPESDGFRDKLRGLLRNNTATIYAGFDATATSLHVGNLVALINLLYFQRHGHRVICVIGDATAKVGDPSGHTRDRKVIAKDVIANNAQSIEQTLKRIFRNFNDHILPTVPTETTQALTQPIILRNSAWYNDKQVVDFVSDTFRMVRVGSILHKTSIRERLATQEGINMAEFSYQIFQAYDWLELRKRYDCRLQLGGSDQGGNIYTGHDLIKKCLGEKDSIGLLTPLITSGKSGKKLGKSTGKPQDGIWLNAEQSSPFDLYQFFHRTPDKNVEMFLKVFSFLDDSHIEDLIKNHLRVREDIWFCQRKLAEQVCLLVHGVEGLNTAKSMTDDLYPRKTTR